MLVEHKRCSGVVHRVLVGAIAGVGLVIHTEIFGRLGGLCFAADQGHKAGVESGHIVGQHLGRIAFWVQSDKNALHLMAFFAQ